MRNLKDAAAKTDDGGEASLISLADLPGVGAQRAAALLKLRLRTLEDLFLHRPKRYEDRRNFLKIAEAAPDTAAFFQGTVLAVSHKRTSRRHLSLLEVRLGDDSGELTCRWWNQPYRVREFRAGMKILVYGKPALAEKTILDQPEVEWNSGDDEAIHMNRIVPVYPLAKGIAQRWLRAFIWRALESRADCLKEPDFGIPFPSDLRRLDAVRSLHFPAEMEQVLAARRHFAREELFRFQLDLQSRRLRFLQKAKAPPCSAGEERLQSFLEQIPFRLTQSQSRVLREIRRDLGRSVPMRRLLQGDVGSGKTVVAAAAAVLVLANGFDAAFMAPTELLAQQHCRTLSDLLAALPIVPSLLIGGSRKWQMPSSPALTVGTHALLEDAYQPPRLGLAVIDEQHRFGVDQRNRLLRKGRYPHLLTMTATPIPRSLGLTLYGELEHSILDELPPQRGSLKTYVRRADRLERIWAFLCQKLKEGRQAYVVYPRIEETGDGQIKSLQSEFHKIEKIVAPFRAGWIHGQLPRESSAQVMAEFRANRLQVLVSTTMIEVGVDVPNATVMLVENAEQFGLAQLHQIRGRIGRGSCDSQCILVSREKNESAHERLKILESTRDGFAIAEHDLKLRGPGEFLGKQQSGLPRFRFTDLIRDGNLVREARDSVRAHLGIEAVEANPLENSSLFPGQ